MTETIRLNRYANIPWGFRLTGGYDFRTWLSVVKVIGGSIAQLSGVKVGDIVVEINGQSTQCFTHSDAQKFIGASGNLLTLTIYRGSLMFQNNATHNNEKFLQISDTTAIGNVMSEEDEPITETLGKDIGLNEYKCEHADVEPEMVQPSHKMDVNPDDNEFRTPDIDAEIAAILTGNEELLEEGILGINFKKFVPQVDFIRQSEVFKYLQTENTKGEIPEEVQLIKEPTKRFSTFLQKPKSSKPNSREQLWHYPNAPRYLPREKRKVDELPKRRTFKGLEGHTVLWLFLGESCEHVVDERWGNEEEEKVNLSRCEKDTSSVTSGSEEDNIQDKIDSSPQTTEQIVSADEFCS